MCNTHWVLQAGACPIMGIVAIWRKTYVLYLFLYVHYDDYHNKCTETHINNMIVSFYNESFPLHQISSLKVAGHAHDQVYRARRSVILTEWSPQNRSTRLHEINVVFNLPG